ncbi:MAG: thermonuclease family protein [Deltaproteobacteria bacterium]|nr:thermonuclease family protein [Deltaproteobacteria bacterium]
MQGIPYRAKRRSFLRSPLGHVVLLALAALGAYLAGRWSGVDREQRPTTSTSADLPASVRGRPIVIDGDSLDFGKVRVRLYGVDAFERDQLCRRGDGTHFPCGQVAKTMLVNLVAQDMVSCQRRDVDVYGRVVAVCRVADFDVGAELVKAGLALAYRHYSSDYVDDEDNARAARRGAWDGSFRAPWDWRHDKRN